MRQETPGKDDGGKMKRLNLEKLLNASSLVFKLFQ